LHSLGYSDDPRVPTNLLQGPNITADDRYMWLIPFTKDSLHHVQITLKNKTKFNRDTIHRIRYMKVFNYNKSPDDVCRGASLVRLAMNGKGLTIYPLHFTVYNARFLRCFLLKANSFSIYL